jgi:RinA family phage transcriptional activator
LNELSKAKLADLEEDFRNYHNIPKKIAEVLVAKEWRPEDENSWIKGSTGHTEKALNDLIKREEDKSYLYYSKLYADIGRAYDSLNEELRAIVDKYFWGDSDYMGWIEIGKDTYCSTAGIYKKRYKILKALALERGIMAKVE